MDTSTLRSDDKPVQTDSQLLKENVDKLTISSGATDTKSVGKSDKELSDSQKKEVEALKKRDQEVRAHESAHLSAGGGLASGPTYTYTSGPDGKTICNWRRSKK